LQKVFAAAESEAGKLRDEYISAEHLFLGLLEQWRDHAQENFQANA